MKENELKNNEELKESNQLRLKVFKARQLKHGRAKKAVTEENAIMPKTETKRKGGGSLIFGEPEAKKIKEIIMRNDWERKICDLTNGIEDEVEEVPKLIEKLEYLPLIPSATEVAKCLEGASELMNGGKYLGFQM